MTGHSNRTDRPATRRGEMSAASPRMNAMLKMFEPTALLSAISGFASSAAWTETTSSGIDVPIATTVKPMTAGLTRSRVEMLVAPRTRSSPPATSSARPATTLSAGPIILAKSQTMRARTRH